MKFKKIMFVGIVLLVIFAIGAVSASDVNDTTIVNEDYNVIEIENQNSVDDNLTLYDDGLLQEDSFEEMDFIDEEDEFSLSPPKDGTFSALNYEVNHKKGSTTILKDKYYSFKKNYDPYYDPLSDDIEFRGIHLTVENSLTINGNGATIDGKNLAKAIYIDDCNKIILKNFKFVNCKGGINLDSSNNCQIVDCSFVNCNEAIYLQNSKNCIISNCKFEKCYNHAIVIDIDCYKCSIKNCRFVNCHADYGGAIRGNCKKLSISNCNFKNCRAFQGGAIDCLGDWKVSVSNCRFVNCHQGVNYGKKYCIVDYDYCKISGCKFIVNVIPTKIIASQKTFKLKTKTKKYMVTFKTNKNKAIKNVKLILKVNGKKYIVKTNSKGKSTFKITKLTKKGKYVASINFIGDSKYKAANKKIKIYVK